VESGDVQVAISCLVRLIALWMMTSSPLELLHLGELDLIGFEDALRLFLRLDQRAQRLDLGDQLVVRCAALRSGIGSGSCRASHHGHGAVSAARARFLLALARCEKLCVAAS